MARSIDPAPRAVRGFVPARTDEERFLMRHVEDLARAAEERGIARYSGFLSDREQDLARAALNRADVPESDHHFEGGWPGAERKLLCLEPEGCYPASPLCCVKLTCRTLSGKLGLYNILFLPELIDGLPDGGAGHAEGLADALAGDRLPRVQQQGENFFFQHDKYPLDFSFGFVYCKPVSKFGLQKENFLCSTERH